MDEQNKKKRKKNHYAPNKDILEELVKSHEKGQITNRLAELLMAIVDNYAKIHWWNRYSFLDDMKAEALVNLVKNWHKFDMTRKNPHAYFTKCVFHTFRQTSMKEKSHRDLRDELMLKGGLNPSNNFMLEHELNDYDE